jgi:hypothetical protein
VAGPSIDWGPWTAARFQTEDARDGFVRSVANAQDGGWDAEAMPDDGLGAQTRWRPGRFLGLNDLAYAHGGRIVVGRSDVALATDQEPGVKTCPWCKGSRRCATCEGTGTRVVKTRILHRIQAAACSACAGTGVCQLCKRLDKAP